eukprot:GEMP01001338.1.p1 GENE.GEMP01001338.1~~GEMP01001338.1.p1  ORF type:complete len:1281 (+),score=364.85 GEMP01001338.1:85-3927(+)
MATTLTVQGFAGHLMALNGVYQQQETNHGKPTYKKRAELDGTTQCCVYFWDERDGDALAGWWMAPEVGGEQVWAHCVSRNPTPPSRGWKVPWHASTPDPKVVMELKPGGAPLATPAAAQAQFGFKRGLDQQNAANKFQRTAFGQSANQGMGMPYNAANQMTRFPAGGHPAMQNARGNAQKEKNIVQVNAGVTTAENAVSKLSGPESKNPNFDKQRHMSMAKSAVSSAQRCLDGHVKTGGLDEASISTQRARLQQLDTDLKALEEAHIVEQKQKLENLKNNYVTELTDLVQKAEKLVEKTKDAAALFTCEMAEHIKPEDAIEAKEKTDAEAGPAGEALKMAKDLLFTRDREIRMFPPADVASIRESVKPLNNRLSTADKELLNVKAQATTSVRKAQQLLAKIKREEEVQKAREERERVNKWNKELLGFAYQMGLVADDVMKTCEEGGSNGGYQEAEAITLGLKGELLKRQESKECQPQTKQHLSQFIRKIDAILVKIRQMLKEQSNKDTDTVRRMAVEIATAARIKQGNMGDAEYFSKIVGKNEKMDSIRFEKFIKSLNIPCDCVSLLFKETCKYISNECSQLTRDEFFLHVMNAYHMVMKPSAMSKEEDPNSEKLGALEPNNIVQVLEGPKEVAGVIRVKVSQKTKEGETTDGWATLRAQGQDFLLRYSPHYVVLSETVLTDTFDLKGFKVVRRIKPDEKFRALNLPQFNTESAMWRINGVTEKGENVWVTIQGNRGTPLLRNEPLSTVGGESDTTAIEFDESKFNLKLKTMAVESLRSCVILVDEATEAKEKIDQRLETLEEMDEDDKEPTQEEVQEMTKSLEELFTTQKSASIKAITLVKQLLQNLQNVESGPFVEIKEELTGFQNAFGATSTEIHTLREKQRNLAKSVCKKEYERRMTREKIEQEALAKKLVEQIKPYDKKLEELTVALSDLEERDPPTLADSLRNFCDKSALMTKDVSTLKASTEEVKTWVEENIPKNCKGVLQEPHNELNRLRSKCFHILQKCGRFANRAVSLETTLKEKTRVEFALCLKAHVAKKHKNAEDFFEHTFKGAETIELDAFVAFAKKICKEVPCYEALLKSTVGTTTLAKEHFTVLSNVSYRCLKRTLVTDTIEVKTCKRLRKIEPEEIVEVLSRHEIDPSTNLVRFRGRVGDVEGYVTIAGNKGSTYVKLQQNGYRVVKETVFTDKFEMSDFKVLRRLKEGDFLRGLTNPQLEEKSTLWRMKAQSLDKENEVGWVTIKGNQGSTFLVNCELPEEKQLDAAEEQPDEKNTDAEMAEA